MANSRTAGLSARCRRMLAAATHAAPPAWQRRRWSVAARTAHMPCQPAPKLWLEAAICSTRVVNYHTPEPRVAHTAHRYEQRTPEMTLLMQGLRVVGKKTPFHHVW